MFRPPTISLCGMELDAIDATGLADRMWADLERGVGGWVITANLDFLRRYAKDIEAREIYDAADIRVADGMPLIWAARLQGTPLPERIAGSSFIFDLAERAAETGRTLYLLGGDPGAAEGANYELCRRFPQLRIVGTSSPRVSTPPTSDELEPIVARLEALRPDIVLVALGSPKQEHLIHALRRTLPSSWFIGVGISFSFAAGMVRRAPPWMQRWGLEWVHRLAQDPGRLARRYLVDDIPFAAQLFGRIAWAQVRGRKSGNEPSRPDSV